MCLIWSGKCLNKNRAGVQGIPENRFKNEHVSQKQKHLELLDYTRAVAIISVVAFHCLMNTGGQIYWKTWVRDLNIPFSNWLVLPLNLGGLGVAIFFVVSGFCIHLSFQQQGRKYSDFFIRRFFRIYPAYLAAVLLFVFVFPTTALNFSGASSNESWRQLIFHLLLIHNFQAGTYMGINPSFWSLAIEVQLYLLYPLLLFLVARSGWKQALLILGITESLIHLVRTIVEINAISIPHFLNQNGVLFNVLMCGFDLGRSPLAYWFSWSIGAMIADYYIQNKPHPLANVSPMAWVGLIVVCFVFRPLSEFTFMMGCLLTATVLSRSLLNEDIAPKGSGWKFLGKIGVCSYSLYLLHGPIIGIIPTAWLNPFGIIAKLVFLGFAGLIVLMLSWIAYLVIEVPGVRWGKTLVKTLNPRTGREVLAK